MSFDIFENIYTASDPAGGRAIKVSTLTGIDNAQSYYTQTDPAGGRAIKVKIIAGGASTGTLQVEGGVALDGTYRNVTDSASTPNSSPLQLSTSGVKVNGLFTVTGATYMADLYSSTNIKSDYTFSIGATGYLKIGNQSLTDPYTFAPGTNSHSGLYYSGFNKDYALPYHSFTGLNSYWTSGGSAGSLTSPVGIAFFKGNFGIQTTSTNTPSDFRMLNVVYNINNTQSASGKIFTGIYVDSTQTNLNGAGHNLIDLRVNGGSVFNVTSGSNVNANSFSPGFSLFLTQSGANTFLLQNATGTASQPTRLKFIGTGTVDGIILKNDAGWFQVVDNSDNPVFFKAKFISADGFATGSVSPTGYLTFYTGPDNSTRYRVAAEKY